MLVLSSCDCNTVCVMIQLIGKQKLRLGTSTKLCLSHAAKNECNLLHWVYNNRLYVNGHYTSKLFWIPECGAFLVKFLPTM